MTDIERKRKQRITQKSDRMGKILDLGSIKRE